MGDLWSKRMHYINIVSNSDDIPFKSKCAPKSGFVIICNATIPGVNSD